MSKIYENTKDVQREKLAQESKWTRSTQRLSLTLGALVSSLGGALFAIDDLKQSKIDTIGQVRKTWRFDRIAANSAILLGVVSIVTSFFAGSAARKAEEKLKELGPQKVVLPTEVEFQESRSSSALDHISRLEKKRESSLNTARDLSS